VKKQRGFSFIELMIVVAIIGILTAIALPAYKDYVTKGRIPDATSNLAALRVQQEQYFQDNRTYVGAPCTASSSYFNFSCTNVLQTTYTVRADGTGPMAGFAYTVDQSNAKTSTMSPDWGGVTVNCWATKKGGGC
jgi:type IV pilus assembly protein PilE